MGLAKIFNYNNVYEHQSTDIDVTLQTVQSIFSWMHPTWRDAKRDVKGGNMWYAHFLSPKKCNTICRSQYVRCDVQMKMEININPIKSAYESNWYATRRHMCLQGIRKILVDESKNTAQQPICECKRIYLTINKCALLRYLFTMRILYVFVCVRCITLWISSHIITNVYVGNNGDHLIKGLQKGIRATTKRNNKTSKTPVIYRLWHSLQQKQKKEIKTNIAIVIATNENEGDLW